MRTKHVLLCATVALLFTAAVAQDSSGAPPPPPTSIPPPPPTPPPPTPPTSAPPPTPPPPTSTVVTTPPPITTAVTTEPSGSIVNPIITPGNNSTPITSGNTTLPTTTINSGNGTLPLSTSATDGPTSPPLPPPTGGPATPTAITGSQSTSDILTVPLPQPTITVATTQAISPIPTDSVAQLPGQRMVNSTDPRIRYQGTSWTPTKSTCDSKVTGMKCQDPRSYLSYRFKALQGGSVFLGSTRSPEAGVYVITLDNVQTKLDGFTTSVDNSCSITWSQTNLDAGFHNLTVFFMGPSPQSSSQSGSFELNTLQLVAEDPSSSVPPASGGRSLLAEISCTAVFFAILLHILSA